MSRSQPRRRVIKTAIKEVVKSQAKNATPTATTTAATPTDDDEPKLAPLSGPGQIRLFSYYGAFIVTTLEKRIWADFLDSTKPPGKPTYCNYHS